jgi:uncharacterized membrane protein YgdD (TMEM256/DUF423 family)
MDKKIISTAALFGMIAIILGAFGAHKLKEVLTLEQLNTFETGVKYQMYHALFLLFVGINATLSLKTKKAIYFLTLFGVVFFSGSIYVLATNSLTAFDFRMIGIITPLGGLLLIMAWSVLLVSYLKKKA